MGFLHPYEDFHPPISTNILLQTLAFSIANPDLLFVLEQKVEEHQNFTLTLPDTQFSLL
jgi:hypothetical protein